MFKGSPWNPTNWLIGCIGCFALMLSASTITLAAQLELSGNIHYQVDYCQTKTQINTIEQAINCDYDSPYDPLSLSFGEAPRWIRIQITSAPEDKQLFSIQVRPHFLREIDFYKFVDEQWVLEKAGSWITEDQKHNDIGGYYFITPATLDDKNTYYLKVQATGIARIFVSVIPWPNSSLRPSEHLLGIGAQLGILLTILVFSLVSLSFNPSAVMARFNVYIFNLIGCILSGSGILALYVFKQMPLFNEMVFFIGLCLKLALWVWLAQAFLRDYKTPNWYSSTCISIYGLVGISVILGCLGKTDQAILMILIGYTATSISQIYAAVKTPKIEQSLRSSLIVSFSASIGLIYLAVASAFLPLEPNNQLPIYLSRLTDFVNPLMMLSIIVFQNRLVRKELIQTRSALAETQLRAEFESTLLKDRKTLVDMFAHELKNPLATISLAIENLNQSKDSKKPSDQRRLENIHSAILSMDSIIERCSLINSIDQKIVPVNTKEIHLNSFISSLIDNLNPERAINLHIDQEIFITSDPQFLKIILQNLLENAIKYSLADTPIQIRIHDSASQQNFVSIEVENKVDPEWTPDPTMLFERFYRHPLAKKNRGSGLGLSICKELCIALGGTIQSQIHTDSVMFIVELPK